MDGVQFTLFARASAVLPQLLPPHEHAACNFSAFSHISYGCCKPFAARPTISASEPAASSTHPRRRPAYVTYLVLSLVGVVGGYLLYMRGQALTARLGDKTPTSWTLLLPVSYALFSALIGTQSVLFSKTLSTLMRATVSGA